MKKIMKDVAKNAIYSLVNFSSKTRIGTYLNEQFINATMAKIIHVPHEGIQFKFNAPNAVCSWRVETFSTKEPETLEWIDRIPEGAILWDVGANVGLYSVYAAKKRNCQVWAFEPAVFNLELLARNVFLNGLADKICIVPLALSEQLGVSQFRMTSTGWGGALSTFGEDIGWDGKSMRSVFEFRTLGLSMMDVVERFAIPQPDYIKMDVDGIEHLILKGGAGLLKNIKGILIEINDGFHEQAEQCCALLSQAGLVLKEKRHSDLSAASMNGSENVYNQIWARKETETKQRS